MKMKESKFKLIKTLCLLFDFYSYLKQKAKKKNSDKLFRYLEIDSFFEIVYDEEDVYGRAYLPLMKRFVDKDVKYENGKVNVSLTNREAASVRDIIEHDFILEIKPFRTNKLAVVLYYEINKPALKVTTTFYNNNKQGETDYGDELHISTFEINYDDLIDFNNDYNKLFEHYCQKIKQEIIDAVRAVITQIK
jgi:hypothetical protein